MITDKCSSVEKWLRRHVRREAHFRFVEGSVMAVLGLITLAVTSYFVGFLLLFIFLEFGAFHWRNAFVEIPRSGIFKFLFLLVLGLSFHGAYRNAWAMDYSELKVSWGTRVSGDLLKGLTTLVCEILFSGPRLIFTAFNSFAKAARLYRLDIPETSAVLLWLWKKGTKVSVTEAASNFPGLNAIRILPQLRDIPGIIWLPKPNGVIILSEDLRNAMAAEISQNTEYPNEQEYSTNEGVGSDLQAQDFASDILEWYETLGLPPFTPVHEVTRKYKLLERYYHQKAKAGRTDDNEIGMNEQFERINHAYRNIVNYSSDAK